MSFNFIYHAIKKMIFSYVKFSYLHISIIYLYFNTSLNCGRSNTFKIYIKYGSF